MARGEIISVRNARNGPHCLRSPRGVVEAQPGYAGGRDQPLKCASARQRKGLLEVIEIQLAQAFGSGSSLHKCAPTRRSCTPPSKRATTAVRAPVAHLYSQWYSRACLFNGASSQILSGRRSRSAGSITGAGRNRSLAPRHPGLGSSGFSRNGQPCACTDPGGGPCRHAPLICSPTARRLPRAATGGRAGSLRKWFPWELRR